MQIRVQLDAKYKERASGPDMFMSRLIRVLEKKHDIKFTSKKPHISLGVILLPPKTSAKRIVRVDGCYYNKSYMSNSLNKQIQKSISKADGVVFQSNFSKQLCQKLLKTEPKNCCVIYNGIDQDWIKTVPPFESDVENIFVSIAAWRNSKRPKSIIKSFIHANIPNSKLFIIGNFEKQILHENVVYLGKQPSEKIISILKRSKGLIHLCKIESCSNAVVESLSCGIPVLCNNIGGTPELVKNDGIIVNCDPAFEYRFIDEKNVDNIDTKLVALEMNKLLQKTWSINRPDLSIDLCANQYYNYFKLILNV